jgi:hypothetical protein
MIKIALKHYIYDYCISLLFDNIKKNFDTSKNFKKNYLKNFKIGDTFKLIKEIDLSMGRSFIYHDCEIVDKCIKNFSDEDEEYIEIICNYIENTVISTGVVNRHKSSGNIIQVNVENIVQIES